MQQVIPLLQEAKKSVQLMNKTELEEIRSMKSPPLMVLFLIINSYIYICIRFKCV